MRLVRNNGYISSKRRTARWMIWGGLLLMVASFPLTLQAHLVVPAYVTLIAGFILFNTGMPQSTKWGRHPRGDEALDDVLRRLNDRYTIVHYPNVPGERPEHVLVYPGGLVVISTRDVPGQVKVDGNRWKRSGRGMLAMFSLGGPQLGNPTAECERQQGTLRAFLEAHELAGADLIEGMIVFISPQAQLEVVSSDTTVVKLNEVLGAVRDLGTEGLIPAKQRDEIVAALAEGDQVEGPTPLPSHEPARKKARAS
ncbi:MAG TPA: nuclease-related domain-containing protein [Thermomicrobiaceae bacterium]|nr:nuclease-related domain-containing protein [Thermomicrobiaceae bacterium]